MSESVIVKEVDAGRPWQSPDGKVSLTFYQVLFDRNGSDFKAEWGKKDPEPPTIGEVLDGEFYEKNGKQRFRLAGTAGSSKREWKPESQYDPEKVARMGRAHAQEMALRWFSIQQRAGQTFGFEDIWKIVDAFEADVDQAAKGLGGTETTPGPTQNGDGGTHQRLAVLLEEAGVDPVAASAIANFAADPERGGLTPQEQDAAIDCLQKPNLRAGAVKRLTERAEEAAGEPLPSATPDGEIPF